MQLPSAEPGLNGGSQHFPHASFSNKYVAAPFLGNELDTHRKTKEGSLVSEVRVIEIADK